MNVKFILAILFDFMAVLLIIWGISRKVARAAPPAPSSLLRVRKWGAPVTALLGSAPILTVVWLHGFEHAQDGINAPWAIPILTTSLCCIFIGFLLIFFTPGLRRSKNIHHNQ